MSPKKKAVSKSLKKLSKTGQSSRTVKDPKSTRKNRPRQGAPVPETPPGEE